MGRRGSWSAPEATILGIQTPEMALNLIEARAARLQVSA